MGNKIDLEERAVGKEEGFKEAEKMQALFAECSAKTGANVDLIFKMITDSLISNDAEEEEVE